MQIKSRTNGRNKSNKLQYNVRIRLPKQKCVFSFRRNTSKDGADVMSSDRMFHNVSFLFFCVEFSPTLRRYICTYLLRWSEVINEWTGQQVNEAAVQKKKKKKNIYFANSKNNYSTNITCKHRGGFPEGQSPIVLDTLSNAEDRGRRSGVRKGSQGVLPPTAAC